MDSSPILQEGKAVGVICWEPMEEASRRSDGDPRWCFNCRKRRAFERVVTAPTDRYSYYGPNVAIECTHCHMTDGDCFPGRYRIWEED